MKKQLGLFVNGENKGATYYNVDTYGLITLAAQDSPILNSAALARHGITRETAVAAIQDNTWRTTIPVGCCCHIGTNDHIEFVDRDVWASRLNADHDSAIHTGKPANAVAAYRKYKGSADRAWENEDEQAAMLINEHYEAPYQQSTDPVTKPDY